MGALGLVFDPPGFDQRVRVRHRDEPVLVQAFIAEAHVQAFDGAVVNGFPWPDEREVYTALLRPGVEDSPRELWSMMKLTLAGHGAAAGASWVRVRLDCRCAYLTRGVGALHSHGGLLDRK